MGIRRWTLTISSCLVIASGCADHEAPMQVRPVKSGSSVFNHIKTFEIVFEKELTEAETDFVARHYDIFLGRPMLPDLYDINPNIILLAYMSTASIRPNTYSPGCATGSLCAETFAAAHGYDFESFFLHYRGDVSYLWTFQDGGSHLVEVGGWSPDWQPGDPPASASDRSESRVYGTWGVTERWANIGYEGWQHWSCERVVAAIEIGSFQADGVMVDEIVTTPGEVAYLRLDYTHEYWTQPMDEGSPVIDNAYSFMPVLRDYICQAFGEPKILLGNGEALYYLATDPVNSPRLQERFEWILLENGVKYDPYNYIQCAAYGKWTGLQKIEDLAEDGKKILITGLVKYDSDIGSMFTLGAFYLVNHPNLYFGKNVNRWEEVNWFDAIGYDIGSPLGPAQDNWATGSDPSNPSLDIHVVAREYTNALVVVRFRDINATNISGSSATTHALGGTFYPLQVDGTLGAPITEVTLRNCEAAILIRPESLKHRP